ncbi:class III lanthionine synthetase LanKC [Nonomuraea antri]|uniref:class III lanthionine synthetase LanKC n=1 Tax=Nonomuraea antri TaxID=2730852 RepID=UPI001C2C8B9C|nr:class III lanthionine synthetase LanKC [Nonomuraea antri]
MAQFYTRADPLFYDDVTRWSSGAGFLADAEFEVSARPVPEGWARRRHTVWTTVEPAGHPYPAQGWKIHVSATLENADRLCTIVWDYCVARGIPFKHLLNRNMLLAFNAKYTPRGNSGKLITIYPDEERFESVVTELAALTAGERGPYVLSDVRIGEGPLYVRFGAFVRMRCVDEAGELTMGVRRPDGTLVPDHRRAYFSPPDWAPVPAVLGPHVAARAAGPDGPAPYVVERALHFSNAGGVYVATRRADGRRVVLKEARPHTAVDNNHLDAVARLRAECWALRRAAGIEGVPELYDEFVMGGHHFLAQEYVEGEPLAVWIGVNHPWVTSAEPTADELAAYTDTAAGIVESLTALVAALHERGVVFGDLHLGNVMVTPEGGAALVDFELAFEPSGTPWRPGLGAMGYAGRDKEGFALDRHALSMIMLAIFLPFAKICALRPEKVFPLTRLAAELFPLPPGWTETILRELAPGGPDDRRDELESRPVPWASVTKRLAQGILHVATPERTDRLFPGDIQQFATGGLSFGYGAAGVLWALDVTGHGRHETCERWLLRAIPRMEFPHPGFYDGVAGLAYALDHLGHPEQAAELLDRHPVPERLGVSLHSGLSGIGAALLHLSARWDEPELRQSALGVAERLAAAVERGDPSAGHAAAQPAGRPKSPPPGLMRGWSGVSLFFLRLYERTGERGHLDLAVRALHRDLDACVTNARGALVAADGGVRLLPYLETGSAGIALVADELLTHTDDDRARESLPALLRACATRLTVQADLFRGKSGHLLTLGRLRHHRPGEAELERHREVLTWHAVELHGHLAVPGNQGYRLSADLATGAAGVLLALADGAPALPFLAPAG